MGTLVPLATITLTGLVNQFVLRPLTVNTMRERKHQGECIVMSSNCPQQLSILKLTPSTETRDGKKSYDKGPHSKEMIALNKKFGRIHGVSSLVNLVSFIATIYYGAVLSKKLQ